jgi:lipoprotein NlpI
VEELGKNQLFLICPEVTTYYEADKDDPWTYLWIGFSGIKARTYLDYANLNENSLTGEYEKTGDTALMRPQQLDASKHLQYARTSSSAKVTCSCSFRP